MEEAGKSSKDTISNPIDYKILGIIFALAVGYQIVLFLIDVSIFNISDILYLAGILGCGISAFIVSNRYRSSEVFGKAYFFLGLGFMSWFIGDSGYLYYEFVLQEDPWPSPFDAGFAGSYVFASIHLVMNTRYFRRKWNIPMKILIVVIPLTVVTSYSLVAYTEWGNSEELPFDLFYGNIFALGISMTLSFAVLGAIVFRQSVLKEVWLLLVIGIFLWTIADVSYVYVEIFGAADDTHPYNTVWMASFMLIIYALYKHQKAI